MPKFDTIFFDLDGTISDSYPGIENGIEVCLRKSGVQNINSELIKKMIGTPLTVSLNKYIFGNEPEKVSTAIGHFQDYYGTKGVYESTPYPNIPNLLNELSKKSQLYIVTAKPTPYAKEILAHQQLDHLFEEIFGYTEGEKFSKADLIAKTGKLKNAIMIGDKGADIIAGKQAGIKTAGVLYGYGTAPEILAAQPDYTLKSTSELIDLLAG